MKAVSNVGELLTDRNIQERLYRLSLVADATDTAVIISDSQWSIIEVNAGFTRMFGWNADEVMGHSPIALISPQQPQSSVNEIRNLLLAGNSLEREEILVGKRGERYWAKVVCNPVMDTDGCLLYTVSTLTDITYAKMHEVLQHKTLEAMVQDRSLEDVLTLICTDIERIVPEVSASILKVESSGKLYPLAGPSFPPYYAQNIAGMQSGEKAGSCGTAVWRNEAVWVDNIATDPLWDDYRHLIMPLGYCACWSNPVRNREGMVVATFALYFRSADNNVNSLFYQTLVGVCSHLCLLALMREDERQSIRQLAFYDSLTGLPNRRLLQMTAEETFNSLTSDDAHLALLFIDLDRFKQINDSLGHPAGDELLRQVAETLRCTVRKTDIVGRLSGDEFVVILQQYTPEQVNHKVECIQKVLTGTRQIFDTNISISASVGIAMYPEDGDDLDTLLRSADIAMYQAKKSGRGKYAFFSNEMNQLVQERSVLENALYSAIKTRQFSLYYQPQLSLTDRHLYGIEALARWRHPTLGDIPPARFIPLAEECGLIADLGDWALDEACRQLAAWRRDALWVPSISVNLSPTCFHNLSLPQTISATLARHGLRPEDLMVELTESVLLDNNPNTLNILMQVRDLGIRLSMDDFGTGYSSLSYLRKLPVSELKLDRSFVADLENDEAARSLSRAILGIGTSLNLTVVAEGVETAEQNLLLQEQGYPVAQGYLFAKPMSAEHIQGWLKEHLRNPN